MAKKSGFPKVKPATNSGIFSKSGAGQKKDPVKTPEHSKMLVRYSHERNMKKSV